MSAEPKASSGTQSEGLGLLYVLMLCVVGLFAAYWFFTIREIPAPNGDWSTRSQFGDMFGAFNALFAALAFSGIIYTVHLQRRELALQRQELIDTRAELARSAKAQEEAQKALTFQLGAMRASAEIAALDTLIRALESDIRTQKDQGIGGGYAFNQLHQKRSKCLAKLEARLQSNGETATT